MPVAGTPMIQPETSSAPSASSAPSTNAVSSPHQTPKDNDPIKKAQDSLNSALRRLNESYQAARNKISQDEDRTTAIVETSFSVFEEIGEKVSEALYFITQQIIYSKEIEEHFSRLEKSLKETITATAT